MPTNSVTTLLVESLAALPPKEREQLLASLSLPELEFLRWDWRSWARPSQLAPAANASGPWRWWLDIAGRGNGKTRTGAEFCHEEVDAGRGHRVALVGRTPKDVRDVMVEGESGILNVGPPAKRPKWYPAKRRLVWPNGALGFTYSAWEPDELRGPQHDLAWGDEMAAWKYRDEAHANLDMGLRLGDHPRGLYTTTPRPVQLLLDMLKRVGDDVVVSRGSTYENAANLPEAFLRAMRERYEGTRLGRQELLGEVLTDVPGALWTRALIEAGRVREDDCPPREEWARTAVAIDPAMTSGEDSNETGIIAGVRTHDGEVYILKDLSGRHDAGEWSSLAVAAYHALEADRVVAEVNQGGDLVEAQLRVVDPNVSYRSVHASKGKRARAEPVAALYEQGRVHHVGGFPQLEDQMANYVPGESENSPDRVDALVWLCHFLVLEPRGVSVQ